ncbi:hypothetical protein EK21DRAFT_90207 [Setomelanomma holmii]|uniref:Uncharacterized protein n=1 Tax=Setomelanomma holmii TaxID=210430 RepID=A0A9P4H6C2_9PLEO|nr:hypothetical protein EK21DRAFT_90207 [Setomelanomma holmii]
MTSPCILCAPQATHDHSPHVEPQSGFWSATNAYSDYPLAHCEDCEVDVDPDHYNHNFERHDRGLDGYHYPQKGDELPRLCGSTQTKDRNEVIWEIPTRPPVPFQPLPPQRSSSAAEWQPFSEAAFQSSYSDYEIVRWDTTTTSLSQRNYNAAEHRTMNYGAQCETASLEFNRELDPASRDASDSCIILGSFQCDVRGCSAKFKDVSSMEKLDRCIVVRKEDARECFEDAMHLRSIIVPGPCSRSTSRSSLSDHVEHRTRHGRADGLESQNGTFVMRMLWRCVFKPIEQNVYDMASTSECGAEA